MDVMSSREDRAERARRNAARIRAQIGDDIRGARLDAGLSQAIAGSAADMSHAQFGRIERAALADLTFDQAGRAAAAVGLRLHARTYPDGDAVRDAAQLALLERFRARLPPGTRWRTEVPLPLPGDRRAWDGVAERNGRRAGCEAETRLRDVQALDRRLALKERDGDVDIVILILADTAANRRALDAHRQVLRARLPLDGRAILESFRVLELPATSGVIVL